MGATLNFRTEADGGLLQTRQVDGAHGQFGQQDSFTQHFGLGDACEGTLTIHWPDEDGSTQEVKIKAPGQYRIVQGE